MTIPSAHAKWIKSRYVETDIPLDRLPYTIEFDRLFVEFHDRFLDASKLSSCPNTKSQFWQLLTSMRKGGYLPKLRKKG